MDSVGGMPILVRNGHPVASPCASYFCSRNPRTGIGVTAAGEVLLVAVDGRKSTSISMTLVAFATYMDSLGAVDAVNLDGGGGSTMWAKGQGLMNDPSDSTGERPVSNAVLVLPAPDDAESQPAPYRGAVHGSATVSAAQAAQAMVLAASDPGSTGGLMDALVRGDLGETGPLPPSFLPMARMFRTAGR